MDAFEARLEQAIGNMGWDLIVRVFNATDFIPQTNDEPTLLCS